MILTLETVRLSIVLYFYVLLDSQGVIKRATELVTTQPRSWMEALVKSKIQCQKKASDKPTPYTRKLERNGRNG